MGNSTFIDENFIPYDDQWRFLYQLTKLTEEEVTRFIQKTRWTRGDRNYATWPY